jgi:hypothetical protein
VLHTILLSRLARLPYPAPKHEVKEKFSTLARRCNPSRGVMIGEPWQSTLIDSSLSRSRI